VRRCSGNDHPATFPIHLPHDLHPRTVSAGLPESTLSLGADLSPHQAVFNDAVSSDPKMEAPRFNAGLFILAALGKGWGAVWWRRGLLYNASGAVYQ